MVRALSHFAFSSVCEYFGWCCGLWARITELVMFRSTVIANFFLAVVLAQTNNETRCTDSYGLNVCIDRGVVTEVTEQSSNPTKSLALEDTGLVSIKLGAFKNLSITYLSLWPGNQISNLEPGVFAGASELTGINLGDNDVRLLPNLFQELSRLDRLVLTRNHIDYIPDGSFSGLSNLKSLKLNWNNISAVNKTTFDGLSKLEVLHLDGNEIASIVPEAFADLRKLRALDLSYNNLTEIKLNTFTTLSELQYLDISFNKITRIEPNTFVGLNKLTDLRLENNEISYVGAGAFQGLPSVTTISLMNNKFQTLPSGLFAGLPSLRYLYMAGTTWNEDNRNDLQVASSVTVYTTQPGDK